MPIPVESSLVHGVYDEDGKMHHLWEDRTRFAEMVVRCDLGFNSNRFDVPMLAEEFLRVGIDFGLEVDI